MKNKYLNNKGIALITVILIISIIVAVAIELNRSSRAAIYDAANLSDGIKLTYIAKSGFYGAAAVLVDASNDCITLRDNWAQGEILSGKSQSLFDDGYFTVTVEDESGKIPINKLVNNDNRTPNIIFKDILIRLLNEKEFDLDKNNIPVTEIVDSIIEWIKVKNAKLDCIEELLMVKGITSEIFYGTKDKPGLAAFVTADSDGLININTAPKMVLRALDESFTEDSANKMDEYRTQDGSVLSNTSWCNSVTGVTIKAGVIGVNSTNFKIISVGKMKNMEQRLSGVVKRSGKSIQIIKWRQD